MRRADLILGLVVAAVGAYALALALDLAMFSATGQPGPGFFPRLISALLALLGLLLAAVSLRRRRPAAAEQAAPAASAGAATPAIAETATAETATAGSSADERDESEAEAEPASVRRTLRAGTVWLCFALTMPLLALLGFVPAAAALVFVLLFGVESRRNWRSVLVAIVIPVAASAVFTKLLSVPLPQGLLSHGPLGI
jgi:putative tricarboxylic transport membrane protein